jgi:hypothetical protein
MATAHLPYAPGVQAHTKGCRTADVALGSGQVMATMSRVRHLAMPKAGGTFVDEGVDPFAHIFSLEDLSKQVCFDL